MTLNGAGRAVPLGGQQVEIDRMTVYPIAGIDIGEGSPIPGPFTHQIRITLVKQREVIVVPCDSRFLRMLAQQIDRALAQVAN
jgi:hypothetical protein